MKCAYKINIFLLELIRGCRVVYRLIVCFKNIITHLQLEQQGNSVLFLKTNALKKNGSQTTLYSPQESRTWYIYMWYGSHICDFNPNTHSTVSSFSTPSLQGLKWAGKVWNGILTPSVNEQLILTCRLMHIIHVYFFFFKWQDISNGTFQIFQQISANTQTFLCSLSQSVSVS